ncbi:MAG: helix-turn-helix domain-containing protein [Rhodobiaceae bacterium]|nr:helix-turn-helix domain-containing protein [Rhodobiaceae bacterium]
MTPIALSIPEAAAAIGVGRSTFYKLVSAGDIPVIKISNRTLVRVADLETWVAKQPACNRDIARADI